jgi:asparagine synthetase B (glutamine-hydrolysing)
MLSSTDVAKLCGISINRFSVLKSSPYYQKIHNQYMTGILTMLDSNIKNGYVISQQTLEFGLPIAMQGLIKQALTAKDERVKNKAFNDILDRDGRFAKVSRIGLTTSGEAGVAEDKDNRAVLEMIQALNNGNTKSSPNAAGQQAVSLTDKVQ